MSNARPTPHPTRQQLDELEALMQRMLALPVSPAAGEPPPAPPAPAPEAPENAPAAEAAPVAAPPPGTEFSSFLPPAPLPEPEPRAGEVEERDAEPAPPAPTADRPSRPAGRRRPVGRGLRPLLWVNGAFDRATVRLGGPGRWLRGPRGRAWLGGTGLVLLATAVAWGVLDWMGWPW